MVQIDKYKVCQARWGLGRKKKSLSTSCDNDEDTAGIRVISIIDKGNLHLHLPIMMKMEPPTTYYVIAHRGK